MAPPSIYVLAGVNGAGKSSIGAAMFREQGADTYDPDGFARALMARDPALSQARANALAWANGVTLLERAITRRLYFAFETTLGGNTIPRLLAKAADLGIAIRIWYVGLSSPEVHIARVHARVARGGHDIPEADIRRRFRHSRLHLIDLMPKLAALRVYDNSVEADPAAGKSPAPKLILHMQRARIVGPRNLLATPDWAKPVLAAAIRLSRA